MIDPTPAVERVAAVTERLSVLLSAGVTPSAAWRYLADADADADADTDTDTDTDSTSNTTTTETGGDASAETRVPLGTGARPAGGKRSAATRARRSDGGRSVVAAAALAARDGIDVPAAMVDAANENLDGHAWRAVAAAWSVATETGARLAPCLAQLARSQRALGQAQRDIDAALAGPRSTAKFVTLLPVVGVLFGALLGLDTIGTLFTTTPGVVCLALGIILTVLAWRWSRRMVIRALPATSAPGLEIDLLAIALSSGASLPRARSAVDTALDQCRLGQAGDGQIRLQPRRRRGRSRGTFQGAFANKRETEGANEAQVRVNTLAHATDREAIDGVLALSRAAGIPAAELLSSEAARIRRDARSEAQRAAAALGTRLMIPLGLCILPAFMLVGVVPLVLSVLSSTVAGFD